MGTRTSKEPLIKLKVSPQWQEVSFLVDTGTERGTLQKLPEGCVTSKEKVFVIRIKGDPFKVSVIEM